MLKRKCYEQTCFGDSSRIVGAGPVFLNLARKDRLLVALGSPNSVGGRRPADWPDA
jgi:hypothetical protein